MGESESNSNLICICQPTSVAVTGAGARFWSNSTMAERKPPRLP
jgi:hypothetical protein